MCLQRQTHAHTQEYHKSPKWKPERYAKDLSGHKQADVMTTLMQLEPLSWFCIGFILLGMEPTLRVIYFSKTLGENKFFSLQVFTLSASSSTAFLSFARKDLMKISLVEPNVPKSLTLCIVLLWVLLVFVLIGCRSLDDDDRVRN